MSSDWRFGIKSGESRSEVRVTFPIDMPSTESTENDDISGSSEFATSARIERGNRQRLKGSLEDDEV
jgi:hypothetical protein